MKHTIPIDATKSIQLEDVGSECHVRLLTFGVAAMKQIVPPELLVGLAQASLTVARAAVEHRGGVRCHDAEACKLGQAACPTPQACGLGG